MTTAMTHRLSDETGVRENNQGIVLEDATGSSPRRITSLTVDEVVGLYAWWTDGKCPVCGAEVNQGEIVCDGCYADASRFPAREDALTAQEAR